MINTSWAGCNSLRCNRKNSRTRLFTRFLRTASPTLRLTVTPSLPSGSGPGARMTTKCGLRRPRLRDCNSRNSARLRIRRRRGNVRSESAARALGRRRDDKLLPALRPSALQNLPSSGGCHAGQEPMLTAAPHVARLIRSFHVWPSRRVISPGKRRYDSPKRVAYLTATRLSILS